MRGRKKTKCGRGKKTKKRAFKGHRHLKTRGGGGCLPSVRDSNRQNPGLSFRAGRALRARISRRDAALPPRVAGRKRRVVDTRGITTGGNRSRRAPNRASDLRRRNLFEGALTRSGRLCLTFVRLSIRRRLRPPVVVALSFLLPDRDDDAPLAHSNRRRFDHT